MTMTELLVIIVIIIFVLVLLDGLRRNLGERRKRVVIKLDKKSPKTEFSDDELFISELPNGGARSLQRDSDSIPRIVKSKPKLKSVVAAQEQHKAHSVPVLLDAVELEEEEIEHTNVFADTSSTPAGASEDYESDDNVKEENDMGVYEEDIEEFIDGLDNGYDDVESDFDNKKSNNGASVQPRASIQSGGDEDDDEWDDDEDDDLEVWEEDWEEDDFDADGKDDAEDDGLDDDDVDLDDEEEDEDDSEPEEFPAEFPDDVDEDIYNKAGAIPAQSNNANTGSSARNDQRNDKRNDRIEPGFGDDVLDTYEFEGNFDPAFAEDDAEVMARKPASNPPDKPGGEHRSVFGAGFLSKKDQGELFREEAAKAATQSQPAGPQEVIVINVMAKPGSLFEGYELLPILQLQGMRLGDMSIFHKHSGSNASGTVLFSMANMVKPGTFDLATMESFTSPGVSFFLQLPNKYGNMACFDQMLTASNALKHSLDGELKDENRSVFTRQTMEHYRQRIRDFELKLLSRK